MKVYHLSSLSNYVKSETEDEESEDEASESPTPEVMTKISERSTKGKALSHAVR